MRRPKKPDQRDRDLAVRVAEQAGIVSRRQLYALGFTPTNLDGKEHRLEVRAKSGMATRARRSYIASRDRFTATN